MGNPYATDEDSATLWFEQTLYAGNALGLIIYGIHVMVWYLTIYHIFLNRKRRSPWFNALFVTSLFISGTICLVMEIYFGQKAWVNLRNYPGGPAGYIFDAEAQPINTVGAIFSTIIVLIGDALLIYRAYIVWGSKLYIVVLPIMHWLVVGVLGFIVAWAQSIPSSSLYSSLTEKTGTPYFALEMSLNVICTLLILVPLVQTRRYVTHVLGARHGQLYTSILSIIIESALPNAVFSFIWVVLYAKKNTAENLIITLLLQVQCIAPELIILRIVSGIAWDKTTHDNLTNRATGSSGSQRYELDHRHDPDQSGTIAPAHSGLVFEPTTDTMMAESKAEMEV